ncbi:MAG: M48 family metallopeptidase [Candidatus Acidiferrum sp.]
MSVIFVGIFSAWMGSPRTQAAVPVPCGGILGQGNAGGAEAPRLQQRDDGADLHVTAQAQAGGNALRAQSSENPGSAANAQNAERITRYTLTPERERKARALAAVRLRQWAVELVYGLVVLLAVLWWKLGAKYRDVAEKISEKRFVQVLVFAPLIALTIDVLELPTGIYENWLEREYGLSVQGWGSWLWDWTKGELLSVIVAIVVVGILYRVIAKSPRRWWFYFWLATIPLILAVIFIAPLVIDPMFHKFEPLQKKDPVLTAELEKMVQRSGQTIPPERMYWMGAGEKTTELNAYVTGFGASKRIVVWDTTIAKMNTPQIVFVAGHEMGHYVLHHVPKGIAFAELVLLVTFYLGYRLIGGVLARWGPAWGIRGIGDLASYPAMLLVASIVATVIGPVGNTFSRHLEHQADQYGLEVTHGLTADAGEVAAQSFNILGDVDLSDPAPARWRVILFYTHPAIPERILFALGYDPWAGGGTGEFVK